MLNYQQALHLLDTLLIQNRLQSATATTAEEIVQRETQLLETLQSPHVNYPVIHIAGTKGKGSTAATLAAILQSAGLRVGLYTSPHLESVRERVQINGTIISEADFAAHIQRLAHFIQTMDSLRWFEAVTALAFDYFAAQKVDIAVIEAGMGGRRDATNVVTPILSIITSLSFDHTHLFGKSLPDIAAEKAGIIKRGVPVITAPQPDAALNVIRQVASRQSAPLTVVGTDVPFKLAPPSLQGQTIELASDNKTTEQYSTRLIGHHQGLNTAVAITAIVHLRRMGWAIENHMMHNGLRSIQWQGRFEVLPTVPLVVLDAAHNPASIAYFIETLITLFPEKNIRLIFGASADKNFEAMLGHFLGRVKQVILTQAGSGRAAVPIDLATTAQKVGFAAAQVTVIEKLAMALDIALQNANIDDLIAITGSVYIVGEARALLTTARSVISDAMDNIHSS